MNTQRLSIIIPIFNEESTVEAVIERVRAISFEDWGIEIIAVNDGSTDGTKEVLNKYTSDITVIHLLKNSGKGSAVKAGIDASTGDFALIQDADLECQPEEIPLLLKALQDNIVEGKIAVMGSRELLKDNHKSKLFARLGSLSITKFINFLYNASLTDTLMGYKLFPRVTFDHFRAGGFDAEMLFLCYLLEQGYRIVEVPVSYTPRDKKAGKKINHWQGFKILYKIGIFWLKGLFRLN
jgi:glycosyltransferase involved in cell wall biosynthesis